MLEQLMQSLTDEELQSCFIEMVNWNRTGVYEFDSKIRKLCLHYQKISGEKIVTDHDMWEHILFEIAVRKYREDGLNV